MDRFIKAIYKICAVVFTVCVFLTTGFLAIIAPALNPSFYAEQFRKIDLFGAPVIETVRAQAFYIEQRQAHEYIAQITEEQLVGLMMHTIAYCLHLEDDLNITVDGEYLEIFRQDEISHMQDVKNIFGGGIILTAISTMFLVVLLCLGLVKKKGYYENCRKTPYFTLIAIFALFAILGVVIAVDFNGAFDLFHRIFFSGNYAFADGVMIAMISNIFFDLVPIIFIVWIVMLGLFTGGIALYNYTLSLKFEQNQ